MEFDEASGQSGFDRPLWLLSGHYSSLPVQSGQVGEAMSFIELQTKTDMK